MPISKIAESARNRTPRFDRGLSGRKKVALGLAAFAMLIIGSLVYGWLRAWTPRLALRTRGGNYPIAFSVDGSTLATGSASGGIMLWDPEDGRKRAEWPSPDGRRWAFGKFSPDGRAFAATWFMAATPGLVRVDLVDVATGRVRWTVPPPLPNILGIAYRDEGRALRLVAGDLKSRVFVDIDLANGQVGPARPLSTSHLPWSRTSLSDDGRLLAIVDGRTTPGSPSGYESVVVWDLDRDRQVSAIPSPGPGQWIMSLDLSPDGKSLAIGRRERPVEVWDVAKARLESQWPIHGPHYQPCMVSFSPDGSKLASAALFNSPRLSFDTLTYLKKRMMGNPNPLIFEMVVIDLADGRALGRSGTEGWTVVFSKDGRTLAASDDDQATKLHDLPGGR